MQVLLEYLLNFGLILLLLTITGFWEVVNVFLREFDEKQADKNKS
jgi:hypothetical protein